MTNPEDREASFHYEDGVPVFNRRLAEVEREQEKARERDEVYITQQLDLNRRMVRFTLALVLVGIASGSISIWQASIGNKSAKAARSSARTARGNEKERERSPSACT
jgi:hypothetical protein